MENLTGRILPVRPLPCVVPCKLYFAVNPIYSVIMGVFAGKNIKRLWGMPVISAVLFLLGSWIFFSMGERAFILYAGVYLILGMAAMTISMIIHRKAQR